jgi:hypothetical protein
VAPGQAGGDQVNCDCCGGPVGQNEGETQPYYVGGHWSISRFSRRVNDEEGDSFDDHEPWDEYVVCDECDTKLKAAIDRVFGSQKGEGGK